MPLPHNEEPGAKPIARFSSDSLVGIPLKKRRFLLEFQSSQEESPQPVEIKSVENPSKPSQDSSISNANVASSSPQLSIADKTSYVEERKESQIVCNLPRVKIEDPIPSISSDSIVDMERKLKNADEKQAVQIDELKSEGICKKDLSTPVGNTGFSLETKKLIGQISTSENIGNLHQKQEKVDPISLNLFSSKGKSILQSQSDNIESNMNRADLFSNRSMWDLNTTMDAWESSIDDAATCEVATQTLSLAQKVSDIVSSGSKKFEDIEHRPIISSSSSLSKQQYRSNDSLNLRLSPSYADSCFSEGQSSSSARINPGSFSRNLHMPRMMVPPCKPNVVGGHNSVKLEPFAESDKQNLKGTKETSKFDLVEKCIPLKLMNSSIATIVGSIPIKSEQPSFDTQKTHVSGSGNVSNIFNDDPQEVCKTMEKSCPKIEVNKLNEISSSLNIDDHSELCRLNLTDRHFIDKSRNGDGSASDDEKINISADMLEEEDSYSSDYVSDGNHLDASARNRDDDDYEDGEFREPSLVRAAATEDLMCEKIEEKFICSDDKKPDISGLTVDEATSYIDEKIDHGKAVNELSEEPIDEVVDENLEQGTNKATSLHNSMPIEALSSGPNRTEPINTCQIKLIDQSYEETIEEKQGGKMEEKNDSSFSKAEEKSLHGDDLAKEKSNRSRIINLKLSNVSSSSCKTRSIPGTSRTGRERFSDSLLEDDKLCHSRGREEFYNEGPHRFSTERNRDNQFFRSSRGNYGRGRGGRGTNRPNTNWNSDREFSPEFYNNGSMDFRFPRRRHGGFSVNDEEFDGDDYRPFASSRGRGRGRKPLNDEGQFRHFPSRRRSPVGRRGDQMIRRAPRNFSEEGLPEDIVDDSNMFTRTQTSYEGRDGHFNRGRRNFNSFRGRGSPPPRRRTSPDTFNNGRPGFNPRRYRTDRMISPARSRSPTFHPRTTRNNRRYNNNAGPSESTSNDEFFENPIRPPPGRFHEMRGGDERRRSRGRGCNFRPRCVDSEEENFHFNREEGSRRPYRICTEPEEESEFNGRGNLREREFDRPPPIKSRPEGVHVPSRRMREINEEDGNFRQGGGAQQQQQQGWHSDDDDHHDDHDDGFDDIRRKRRRF